MVSHRIKQVNGRKVQNWLQQLKVYHRLCSSLVFSISSSLVQGLVFTYCFRSCVLAAYVLLMKLLSISGEKIHLLSILLVMAMRSIPLRTLVLMEILWREEKTKESSTRSGLIQPFCLLVSKETIKSFLQLTEAT